MKLHPRQPTPHHRFGAAALFTSAALLLSACGSMSEREQGTAKGAGVGAVAGAVLGGVSGGNAGRAAVIGGVVGAVAGNLWTKRLEDKRRAVAEAAAQSGTGVAVDRTPDNRLKVNVPADASFDLGRADLKPGLRPVLDELGRGVDKDLRITVVGHTDSSGGDAINDPLSRERAEAVRDYLSVRGVPRERISVVGRGSHEPVAGNDSDSQRAQNRRVEIFLSEPAG
jgi:outer membrane protein OmpA-like peptidoglycan-associated protein